MERYRCAAVFKIKEEIPFTQYVIGFGDRQIHSHIRLYTGDRNGSKKQHITGEERNYLLSST